MQITLLAGGNAQAGAIAYGDIAAAADIVAKRFKPDGVVVDPVGIGTKRIKTNGIVGIPIDIAKKRRRQQLC